MEENKGSKKNLCNFCYRLVEDTLTVCPNCGHEIDVKIPMKSYNEIQKAPLKQIISSPYVMILLLLVIVFMIIDGVILSLHPNQLLKSMFLVPFFAVPSVFLGLLLMLLSVIFTSGPRFKYLMVFNPRLAGYDARAQYDGNAIDKRVYYEGMGAFIGFFGLVLFFNACIVTALI